jgi:speckle-type POZ protein
MLRTKRFSSLFRHYAKYHGLRKDDLDYYFVNSLENEHTPGSVQLQQGDTIMVRNRKKAEPPEVATDDDEFIRGMRKLFDDEEHMDAVFLVHSEVPIDDNSKMDSDEDLVEIRAHKCILTARTDYFKALFREGAALASGKNSGAAFRESEEYTLITVEPMFGAVHVRYLLEFIYTNRICFIRSISTEDLLSLLHLSDKWLLQDLKRLVEHELVRYHMSVHTVARMYGVTDDVKALRLSRACIDYIMTNLKQVTSNATFEEEMKNYPHLCIPILKAAADMIPGEPVHKKQRTDHGTNATSTSATQSSAAASPRRRSTVLGRHSWKDSCGRVVSKSQRHC